MRHLTKRRWNAIDALYIGAAWGALDHSYVLAAVVFVVGTVVSIMLETRYGKD